MRLQSSHMRRHPSATWLLALMVKLVDTQHLVLSQLTLFVSISRNWSRTYAFQSLQSYVDFLVHFSKRSFLDDASMKNRQKMSLRPTSISIDILSSLHLNGLSLPLANSEQHIRFCPKSLCSDFRRLRTRMQEVEKHLLLGKMLSGTPAAFGNLFHSLSQIGNLDV